MIKKLLICSFILLCFWGFFGNKSFAGTEVSIGTITNYFNGGGDIGLNFSGSAFLIASKTGSPYYSMNLFSSTGSIISTATIQNASSTPKQIIYKSPSFAYIFYNGQIYYVDNTKIIRLLGNNTYIYKFLIYNGEFYFLKHSDTTNVYKDIGGSSSINTLFTYSFANSYFIDSSNYTGDGGSDEIIYSAFEGGITQNIKYSYKFDKYYLQTITDLGGTFGSSSVEIFIGSLTGGELEKINLPSNYKTNISFTDFFTFDSGGYRYYYITSCFNVTKTIEIAGSGTTSNNITFIGNKLLSGGSPSGFVGLDNKYYKGALNGIWLKILNYTDFNYYGSECNRGISFFDFVSNLPQKLLYIKSGTIYNYLLSTEEISLITGNTVSGGTGSTYNEFSGSGSYTDDEVINDIWNLDTNGDGDVSTIESVLAPYTIAKNIIVKLYESLKNLWLFFKAILEIGHISFIPNTYASTDATDLMLKIGSGSSAIFNNTDEKLTPVSNLINYIKYGFFFGLFMVILLILFISKINKQ